MLRNKLYIDAKELKDSEPQLFCTAHICLIFKLNTYADYRVKYDELRQIVRMPKGPELLYILRCEHSKLKTQYDRDYDALFRIKKSRSLSGVLTVAVFTSPYPTSQGKIQKFSCQWDCYFCPNEPGQPRSYDPREPGNARARKNNYDPVKQFWDRCDQYFINGHPVDKIELIILGGTWESYPKDYRDNFIRDLYYAGNTYYDLEKISNPREKLSLIEERTRNQSVECKIIGLTVETRPDTIKASVLKEFREYGVTRVQMGAQHIDDRLLDTINRRHGEGVTKRALKLLLDNCFKCDAHYMPDLPQPKKTGLSKSTKLTLDTIDRTFDVYQADIKLGFVIATDPDLQFC